MAARPADAIIVSKDSDFPDLLRLLGPPPRIIWLRCGNRSNHEMMRLFDATLPDVLKLLESDALVEVKDAL